jgi:hypothetical protein
VFQDVYLSNNHFSSGPDRRVDQRTEQAFYNAAIVAALQAVDADVYASVGGDLNVYPRPDDPFPNDPSDQLAALYEQLMTNLWDIQVAEDPLSAYSYIYQGQSQTLDQMFVAQAWLNDLVEAKTAHINADFPADFVGDGPRGTSDHDPMSAVYNLKPDVDRLKDLVRYYDSTGDIKRTWATNYLLKRLNKAQWFFDKGMMHVYYFQIRIFRWLVMFWSPRFINHGAASALKEEAKMLLDKNALLIPDDVSEFMKELDDLPTGEVDIFIPLVVTNP